MKKFLIIIFLAIVANVVSVAIAQDFTSTSSMMSSGSQYASTVYAVGASSPIDYSAPSRGRTMVMDDDDDEESGWGDVGDITPIGSPLTPLLLLAVAYMVIKRRKKKLIHN